MTAASPEVRAARMDASKNEFAKRMMDKPIPESMLGGAAARHFYDPPENISLAFGGRPWFHSTDCKTVHRIGLFKGLGWKIGEYVQKQLDDQRINGVRVTIRAATGEPKYDIMFVHHYQNHEEGQEPDNLEPVSYHTIKHLGPLTAAELKPAYAEFLGEHAI